ncbi:FimV/HubP family polar landmark protein, partial [Vibrio fujianensis]|uniref:FimV/HubP family polar landmark protein n=1 Tax=Vibrio fujianensis TaxID=1974215 RepID=UPI001FE6F262
MCQFFKRLLLPLVMVAVTQTSIVSAEGIRLIGPSGEVQSAPQFSREIVRSTAPQAEPSQFFGPTSEQETLWSIASQLRPSADVSVQQTLLAIYRLNPQAFEAQNIHSLLPGSTLRIPSLEQVRKASTQEAVRIMEAHQARLSSTVEPSSPTARVESPAIESPVVEAPVAETALPDNVKAPEEPATQTPSAPAVEATTDGAIAQAELLALEEKNHRLRLLIAQMQSEVADLKQELGDETRIRSEVERILQEERIKKEEAERIGPSTFDQLLANNWFVASLALIPGLLIALLIVMLMRRRSSSSDNQIQPTPIREPEPSQTMTPIPAEDAEIDELSDELLLDDDLFGDTESSEALFTEEDENKEEDIFADLDESDLDFNLESEEGDDPFASIDDDGDLDPNFTDIVDKDSDDAEQANEQSVDLDEEISQQDQTELELSDEPALSQDDMDALLASDELASDTIDQSLLDDLLAGEDDIDDAELDFDSLLENDASTDSELPTLDDVEVTSDQEIEDLLNQVESQATDSSVPDAVDAPSDRAQSNEDLADDVPFDSNSTDLLDEWLDDESDDEKLSDEDLDSTVDQLLDELLGEEPDDQGNEFDRESPTLLDEWIDEVDATSTGEEFDLEKDALSDKSIDDGTEFLDELREIEQQSDNSTAFDSEHFIDDLLKSAPEQDPLLDEVDLTSEPSEPESESESEDEFDFNPQIEGSETALSSNVEPAANEFGIPQDDDWLVEDEIDPVTEIEPAAQETDSDAEHELAPESATLDEPTAASEATTPDETTSDQTTADQTTESQIAESELAEQAAEPDAEVEPESEPLVLDDNELPEYSEADALADSDAEHELAPESAALDEPTAASEATTPEETTSDQTTADQTTESEIVESELAEQAAEPDAEVEPESEPLVLDDNELPEYSEADALADSDAEHELAPESAALDEPTAASEA